MHCLNKWIHDTINVVYGYINQYENTVKICLTCINSACSLKLREKWRKVELWFYKYQKLASGIKNTSTLAYSPSRFILLFCFYPGCDASSDTLVGGTHCVTYIPSSTTWNNARNDAASLNGALGAVYSEEYQDVIERYMSENGATLTWMGARSQHDSNVNTWTSNSGEWIWLNNSIIYLSIFNLIIHYESIQKHEF